MISSACRAQRAGRRCGGSGFRARCRIFSAACASRAGLALIGAVVAEFVAGTGGQGAGLAYQILMSGIQLNIPRLFAALVLIALAGVAMFAATVLVSRLALARWHESELRQEG